MNEKAASAQQKALQERKRGQHAKAVKRLEQAILAFPDELDLHLDAIDACLEGGEVAHATQFLKTVQDRFTKDRERIAAFVRDKLVAVHDPALARFVVENSIKLRDLVTALDHLDRVPEHTVRDLLARTRTKKQSLKSASHGGYALRGELLTNELMAALLSIRLGNMKEAMTAIVQILDEKPVEQAILTPFLASLEGRHSKSGRVRFAHACAQCASGGELEGIGRFVEAARLEPPVATLCADRLRVLRETSKARTRAERALAEVCLIKGDVDEAAAVLRDYLAGVEDAGREVLMLVRPYIDPANGVNACTWLALDAALTLEQSNAALEILRPLHQRAGSSDALLDWLETRSRDGVLTPEIRVLHATLAIERKKYERAAEILQGVCATAPQEVPAVLALLDPHRTADRRLDALCREYAASDAGAGTGASAADGDGDGFQTFDSSGFELASSAPKPAPKAAPRAAPASPSPAPQKPLAFTAATPGAAPRKFMETREISFDDEDVVAAGSVEPVALPETPAPTDDDSGFELSDGPSVTSRPPLSAAAPESTPATPPITEAHVANVARQLYTAGAAAFFHVDREDTQAAAAPEPSAPEEPPLPDTFEGLIGWYREGRLDGERVIALMETAAEEGRVAELRELLAYEPRNDAEDFARRYFEAEHLILCNRPLPAMKILARLDAPGLSDEQRRRVWFKLAVCQRAVRDFAAAHETLTRLAEAYPEREEYARLARTNFEQHLSEQSQETIVLEKTGSLD
ncbi:MAG TPA: tetratricopeptide repeat protein [Candidatus Krumholzibacteria bacterium]|nr:tetratricopeptide repeat protein [Candidatus Krumholzibacteria bacterium]